MGLLRGNAWVKPALALALSAPGVWLAYLIFLELKIPTSGLGPDPVEGLLHYLGEWSMITLLLAFSVTPARRRLGLSGLGRCRRMAGLFAFSYVLVHLLTYAVLYLQLSGALLLEDIIERPYITAGMAAFAGLLVMAATSTRAARRRLGSYWPQLHRAIFFVVPLALLHLFWLRKDGYGDAFVYSLWFCLAAIERIAHQFFGARPAAVRAG